MLRIQSERILISLSGLSEFLEDEKSCVSASELFRAAGRWTQLRNFEKSELRKFFESPAPS